MVLPTDLVLLRTAVVVQTEEHRIRLLRGRSEIDGRFAAPRSDLDEGGLPE